MRDLFLRHAELLHEQLIAFGFLDRVEVLSLEVLDQRELHDLALPCLEHHCGDLFQPCEAGGTPAALAGDDLVIAVLFAAAHGDRRDDAVQADALRQLLERLLVKDLARLVGIWLNFGQGELRDAVGRAGSA